MSTVSTISTSPAPPTAAPNPLQAAGALAKARAPDGDYKAPNATTSHVKDKDGDYKPLTAAASPAAQSSPNVQAGLSSLKVGG